jgi:predicted dehydrogenase
VTFNAQDLSNALAEADFREYAATVVGYGNMGKEYVAALQRLRIGGLRVCSRSERSLEDLRGQRNVEVDAGGVEQFECVPRQGELAIVAVPTDALAAAVRRLLSLGFRRILVEKPVALYSDEIYALHAEAKGAEAEVACAFNRISYPSFFEVLSRVEAEGGISSCHYEFTELIRPDWPDRFDADELNRWGISNSIHVISMAHGLIGLPRVWHAQVHGRTQIDWHQTGSVFSGAGTTRREIPYSYHADWKSTGRWMVEVHTQESSYRLCPLETVQRREKALGPWDDIPVASLDETIKPGLLEQVARALGIGGAFPPQWDLRTCGDLVSYTEDLFGYCKKKIENA